MSQSVISVGGPGADRTGPDYPAIVVMNTILGASFSSRLNTNLRETKGYTYGISSQFAWAPLPGPFVVWAAVALAGAALGSAALVFGQAPGLAR